MVVRPYTGTLPNSAPSFNATFPTPWIPAAQAGQGVLPQGLYMYCSCALKPPLPDPHMAGFLFIEFSDQSSSPQWLSLTTLPLQHSIPFPAFFLLSLTAICNYLIYYYYCLNRTYSPGGAGSLSSLLSAVFP